MLLGCLLLLAAVARIAVLRAGGGGPLVHDSTVYLRMGDAILAESPIASFPNGYPLLIALLRTAVDPSLIVDVLLGLNVLLGTATVWMTVRIGQRVFNGRFLPGFLAGACLAVYPHQLRYTQLVMTEVPGMFFLVAAFWCWFESGTSERTDEGERIAWRFTAGLLAHMAMAIRPSFTLVVPFLLMATGLGRGNVRRCVPLIGGFLLGAALLFGIERIGIVRPSVAPDNNLLIAISSNSRATEFTAFPPEMQAKAKSLYLQFAKDQPLAFLKQRAESLWELWGPKSLPGYRLEQETAIVKAILVARTLLLAGAMAALWRGRRDGGLRALAAPIAGVTLIHVATFSNHRFTAPLEPFLFLLVAGLIVRADVGSREPPPVQ